MVFLDPQSDIAFKKLFGNSEHKNIAISFLNSVLERSEGEKIIEVNFNDPYNLPESKEGKWSILDIYCTDQRNHNFIIEVQVRDESDYAERCQFYTAMALNRQLQRGEEYKKLTPVIFVGVLNFNLFSSPEYLSHHLVFNKKTMEHKLRHFEFHFIELRKFNKTVNELENDLEKWTYLLKNAEEMNEIPNVLQKPAVIQEAFHLLNKLNWTSKDLAAYDRYLDSRRLEASQINMARKEEKLTIAKYLLNTCKMTAQEVALATGLSIEEVEQIEN